MGSQCGAQDKQGVYCLKPVGHEGEHEFMRCESQKHSHQCVKHASHGDMHAASKGPGQGSTYWDNTQASDKVNHPSHYNAGQFEVIDVIEDWSLGFHLGNTVKYIARAPHKGTELEDLKKARWYLNRYIDILEGS